MSEEELCREIKSGAFSMQIADCERNIRIQFEQLQQENKKLNKQLEGKNKPQIFIDTQDIEERYAEGLYQDYLEEENKKYKNQQKEFIEYLNSYIELLSDEQDLFDEVQKDILEEILSKYEDIIDRR